MHKVIFKKFKKIEIVNQSFLKLQKLLSNDYSVDLQNRLCLL